MTAATSMITLCLVLLLLLACADAATLPSYFDDGKHTSPRRSAADYLSGQSSTPCTQRIVCHYVISASRAGISASKIKKNLDYISGYTYSESTLIKWMAYVAAFDSI